MCRTAPDEAVKIDCPNMRGCFNSFVMFAYILWTFIVFCLTTS